MRERRALTQVGGTAALPISLLEAVPRKSVVIERDGDRVFVHIGLHGGDVLHGLDGLTGLRGRAPSDDSRSGQLVLGRLGQGKGREQHEQHREERFQPHVHLR